MFTPFRFLNIPKIKLDEFSNSSFKVGEQPTHVKQKVEENLNFLPKLYEQQYMERVSFPWNKIDLVIKKLTFDRSRRLAIVQRNF